MSPKGPDDRLTLWERLRAGTEVASSLARLLPALALCGVKELSKPKCPRCRERLATHKAQQCFQCGLDWHGCPRPDPRSRDPARWRSEAVASGRRQTHRASALGHDGTNGLRPLIGALAELWGALAELWGEAAWRVRASRWREEIAWSEAGLAPGEVQALKQLIGATPGLDRRIIGVRRLSGDTLEITTGWLGGPLIGTGQKISVRREGDGWLITSVGGWVA
jgi:hypothetical protein